METKICTACGKEKSVDSFRKYYGGRKGHYLYCKECEKIDQRRKYLNRKSELSEAEQTELDAINALYDKRREAGLRILGESKSCGIGVAALVAQQMEEFNDNM